jgi:hypothetical protein
MSIYYGRTGFGYGAYMQLLPYDMKMLNKFIRDDNKKAKNKIYDMLKLKCAYF